VHAHGVGGGGRRALAGLEQAEDEPGLADHGAGFGGGAREGFRQRRARGGRRGGLGPGAGAGQERRGREAAGQGSAGAGARVGVKKQ
jgi:hypothetical protein